MFGKQKKDKNEVVLSKRKSNIYCEIGFVLGLFSLFFAGFFIVPLLAVMVSSIGLITYKNTRHRNKWKAYWGMFLGTVMVLVNFI